MEFIGYFCVLSLCVHLILSVNTFEHKRRSHPLQPTNNNMIEDLVKMSDMKEFKQILQPFLKPRVSGTKENVEVREYIENQMKDLGWYVEKDYFEDNTPFGRKPFTNIVATQNPAKKRTLTLACHFDSKYFTSFKFVGATDSAVPCAMLIDLARNLKDSFQKSTKVTEVTLQLIFFDGEEAFKHWSDTDSTYGARHLAQIFSETNMEVDQEMTVPRIQSMDVLVLLDLIGTANPKFRNWFPHQTGTLYRHLQSIEQVLSSTGNLMPKERNNFYFTGQSSFGGGIQDDHIPFLNRGVRILHLIPYPFPDVWHKEQDNEAAVDYDTIDNLNKILRVFVFSYLNL